MAAHCPIRRIYPLEYDHLVLALGGVTHFFGLPGVGEHALTMKRLADAAALHAHIISTFEMKLPGLERKVRVALDWTLDRFFPRDIVYLRPLRIARGAEIVAEPELEPVSHR